MQFQRFDSKYIVRLDKGEEIVALLKNFCTQENIRLGSIIGIGAAEKIKLAFYSPPQKKFHEKDFPEDYEVSPLSGNITTQENATYIHLHINITDKNFQSFGGHLKEAYVSATLEVIIDSAKGQIDREFSESIGLNLLKFN